MAKNTDKNPDWGGAREGSGRKPETLSTRQVREFERAAKAFADEHGKTLQEVVLAIAYDEDASVKDQLTAAKLYWDKSVILGKEGGEADRVVGPAIFLPEKHPRLAPVVDIGKSDKPTK